jgi:hypothetical protein
MYVRWQSRKRRVPKFGDYGKQLRSGRDYAYTREGSIEQDIHWRAILVESVRVDGKPRQRHIAYLAGFTESAVAIPAQQRFLWDHIKEQLDRLHNRISPEDRKRIEAIMVARIGKPPTKAQRDEFDRRSRQLLGDDWCDEQYGKDFGR